MNINYLNGISKVIGHVQVVGNERGYEPALYIINEKSPRFQGHSFIIALSALYKYVNPFVNNAHPKLIKEDQIKFNELTTRLRVENESLMNIITIGKRKEYIKNMACVVFALALYKAEGILLITGYNLAQCMTMFEIEPIPQAACQLLLFIEDSLDDLRRAPMPFPDSIYNAGGMNVSIEGKKIYSGDWHITESDLMKEQLIQ
jgi:hypothetical protein